MSNKPKDIDYDRVAYNKLYKMGYRNILSPPANELFRSGYDNINWNDTTIQYIINKLNVNHDFGDEYLQPDHTWGNDRSRAMKYTKLEYADKICDQLKLELDEPDNEGEIRIYVEPA